MTGGISALGMSAASAGLAGASLGSTLLGGMQKTPDIQISSAPNAPASQAVKSPTSSAVQAGMVGTGQAGGAPGVAQTFLTGPAGVDPKTLNLGKNTLLGQ